MKTRDFFLICAASLLLTAPAFSATTASQDFALASVQTDWSDTIMVNQFDSSLGTLTGVQIILSGSMNSILDIYNISSKKTSSGTANSEVTITLTASGGLTQSLDLSTPLFSYSLATGGSTSTGTQTDSDSITSLFTSSTILAAFTGSGTTAFNLDAIGETLLQNSGGNTYISEDSTLTAGSTISVAYIYDPVPEPATIGLLCVGALTALRRKIK